MAKQCNVFQAFITISHYLDESLKNLLGTSIQEDKDKAYLGLIRNFKRLFWFVLLEFGNSAVVDKTFVSARQNDLDELNTTDLFKKNATSLRMSDIGYQSKAQKNLDFKYNDLASFLDELKMGIVKPILSFKSLVCSIKMVSISKYLMEYFKLKMSFMTVFDQSVQAKAAKTISTFKRARHSIC